MERPAADRDGTANREVEVIEYLEVCSSITHGGSTEPFPALEYGLL